MIRNRTAYQRSQRRHADFSNTDCHLTRKERAIDSRRYLRGFQVADFAQTALASMSNTLVVLATVLFTVCSTSASPLSFVKGSYIYDPNSIEQNERILNLFVRLAAQTANQLMILKMKANQSPIVYQDGVGEITRLLPAKESPAQAPGLRIMDENERPPSSVAEESTKDPRASIDSSGRDDFEKQTPDDVFGIGITATTESGRDFATANDFEAEDQLLSSERPPSSVLHSFVNEGGEKEAQNPLDSTTLVYDILRTPEMERNIETTTESEEESKSDDDLEAQERLAEHQTPTPDHFRLFFSDKEAEVPRTVSESGLTVDEPITAVYNASGVPESGEQAGVEVENRALFNIEKNNYVTHYTDQSTNIHKADTTVNNFGAANSGSVVVNQEAGSKLNGNGNLGISSQGSSASEVAVGQILGSTGFSGITNLDESGMGKQAVVMTGNSASLASSSLEKSLELNMNHAKTEAAEASVGVNSQSYKLANGQISSFNLNGGFAQAGSFGGINSAKKIESVGKSSGSESRKEVRLQLMSNEKSPPSLDHDLNSSFQGLSASSKESLHKIQNSGNLEGDYQRFRGEAGSSNKQESIIQGQSNAELTHSQEFKAGRNRHQESSSFAISSKQHESLDVQHGLNSQANYEGQIHHADGSRNSGQLSSSLNGAYGSGLKLGGQLSTGLEHISEKKELNNFKDGQLGSVSAGASLQAGNTLETGQGLSAGLGLLGEKVNLEGAIESKAKFGGKLNVSAHVLTG